MPGPNGRGSVTTTVAGSGASTCTGSPSTVSETTSWPLASNCCAARMVKTTSADVNGSPSDHASPGRSVRVNVRPSGEVVHRSASQGSTCWVARLTRTSRAWVRTATTSLTKSRETSRLKDRGSARTDARSRPPRTGAWRLGRLGSTFGARRIGAPNPPSPAEQAANQQQDEERARLSVHVLADRPRNWPIAPRPCFQAEMLGFARFLRAARNPCNAGQSINRRSPLPSHHQHGPHRRPPNPYAAIT